MKIVMELKGQKFHFSKVILWIYFGAFAFKLNFRIVCNVTQVINENLLTPTEENIDYDAINGLATEARQKLKEVTPLSVAQASRIAGVNPADVSILLVYLEQGRIARVSNQ